MVVTAISTEDHLVHEYGVSPPSVRPEISLPPEPSVRPEISLPPGDLAAPGDQERARHGQAETRANRTDPAD